MRKLAALMIGLSAAAHAVVFDRIAVTANRHVITEGEVLLTLRIGAFLDLKPVDLSGEEKRKAASRLVDQYLILEEANFTRLPMPGTADGDDLLGQVKSQFPTETEYRAALERYGLTEAEVLRQLLAGLRTSRFTDVRFRPEIQLSEEDLHDFYDEMVKQWQRDNRTGIPSFEESRSTVERLLTEQRTLQALDRWLGATRTSLRIVYREEIFK